MLLDVIVPALIALAAVGLDEYLRRTRGYGWF